MTNAGERPYDPRPEPLIFPFEDAEQALAAIRTHIDAWEACRKSHIEAVESVRTGFEGQARKGFDQAFDGAMEDVARILESLKGDEEALDKLLREAKVRVDTRNDEIAEWEWRQSFYEEAVESS